eukprot:CAMPEP_0170513176 /NCGR_PEP_ID=MMETSP0208-20121228/67259_1 /TAXON_ID=197538 /ORGANISM="Strombidium inclinatum, Strain S3" /LENGTH=51 /DNA_ID=CAMNT_0010796887 /DNA_START=1019 /DNA_END=1174 /DNA_ORIENTATION=-
MGSLAANSSTMMRQLIQELKTYYQQEIKWQTEVWRSLNSQQDSKIEKGMVG